MNNLYAAFKKTPIRSSSRRRPGSRLLILQSDLTGLRTERPDGKRFAQPLLRGCWRNDDSENEAYSWQRRPSAWFARVCGVVCILLLTLGASVGKAAGPIPPDHARWQQLIRSGQALSVEQKIDRVNGFFNRLEARSDRSLWQQQDYWAMPAEMLSRGGGDCEDFALGKYVTLRALGVPEEQLRLVNGRLYNRDRGGIEAHMMLLYLPRQGEPRLLDNVDKAIKPVSQRDDFTPRYSFNRLGIWRYRDGRWLASGQVQDFGRWQRYLTRVDFSTQPLASAAGLLPGG